MDEKIKIQLGSVQETLLLPLWGRAEEAKRARPALIDPRAVDIITRIDYDFSTIAANISPLSRWAWIARSLFFDGVIRQFLADHPPATVINLGCGLDTTFDRVDNGSVSWYEIDLPDVIALRRQFIPDAERRHTIAASALETDWYAQIPRKEPCMFLAAGVLYYFTEEQVSGMLGSLAGAFPGMEMAFDYSSPRGVQAANRLVIDKGGMDSSAYLIWGIANAKILETWDTRYHILKDEPMYAAYRKYLGWRGTLATVISDWMRIMRLAHLRVEKG